MNSGKHKVFVILSRFPYPLIKGDKLRAYHQIRHLSEKCDIYLCALSDEKVPQSSMAALEPFCKEIHVFHISRFSIFLNIFRFFFFTKLPIQTAYFFNKRIEKRIHNLISDISPDHIYCQLIRTALYVKRIENIPRTIDYMDALSAGMKRRSTSSGSILKWIFNLEANRLKRFEHQIFSEFDRSIIISESDRELIFHYENEDIKIVPNGIDLDFFKFEKGEISYDLLFTGNMSYPPNVQSALYLVNDIMPLVWKTKPQTNLLISGANPVGKIKQLASEKVCVKAWVEDIRTSYSSSKIFCAPMLIGSGLQNKLLEAMAMNMPCISSPLANKSLGATEGKDILIGHSTKEYADHILNLLEKPEKANDLAEKGHSFVANNFSWSKSNQALLELLLNGRN